MLISKSVRILFNIPIPVAKVTLVKNISNIYSHEHQNLIPVSCMAVL